MVDFEYPDRIADVFKNKTVLITGGSGFLGKVLLEKILRCCTNVKRVYVILRPKYGHTIHERLNDIFKSPLFNKLKRQQGFGNFRKIHPITGEMSAPCLGLTDSDQRQLVDEVEIVYHCAANVRFDERLSTAVLVNVRATQAMLRLAHSMTRLQVFFHISTAYCHLHERVINERMYAPPADPQRIISIVERLPDGALSALSHKILDDIPNTYTYTKALAEGLVNKELEAAQVPIVMLRPSFIIPIWKDPLPGWTDTVNGIIGFEIAAGKGVLKVMHTDEGNYADFLPVDVAVSAMLFGAYEYLTYQVTLPLEQRQNIHNLTTSTEHKVTWREIKTIGHRVLADGLPLNWVVSYPDTIMTTHKIVYQILAVFLHLLPALLIDPILIALGYGSVLLKVHRRLLKGFDMMNYYGRNQWEFHNDWSLKTRDLLNPREKEIYVLRGDGIDYVEYFKACALSARRYILNEPDSSLPMARRHLKIMYFVDKMFKLVLGYFLSCQLYYLSQFLLSSLFPTSIITNTYEIF